MLTFDDLPALAVLNLEAFASGEAIRKKASAIAMRARLAGEENGHGAAARRAAEILADPTVWLTESLRWLMLPAGTLDRLGVTTDGLIQDPTETLRSVVEGSSQGGERIHNRAVLATLAAISSMQVSAIVSALDVIRSAKLSIGAVTAERAADARRGAIPASPSVWGRTMSAARERKDARLHDDALRKVRAGYVNGLAQPILGPLRARLTTIASRDLQAVLAGCTRVEEQCQLGTELRDYLLAPLLERCEHLMEEYGTRAGNTDSKTALEALVAETRSHLDQDMDVLIGCGEASSAHAKRVRDSYSELLRTLAIRGCNQHRQFGAAEPLLTRARAVAASEALQSRVAEDLSHAADNAAHGNCVHCKVRDADGVPDEVAMFRVTGRHMGGVNYESLRTLIPRCSGCQAHHSKARRTPGFACLGVISVSIIAALIFVGTRLSRGSGAFPAGSIEAYLHGRGELSSVFGSELVIELILGCGGGAIAVAIVCYLICLGYHWADSDRWIHVPPIAKLLTQGWQLGYAPGKFD